VTSTLRLTVAQAVVRFLAAQHSERDGRRRRLIPAFWGIFGHGNVAGLGEALERHGAELDMPLHRPQNEQAMVHAAAAYAKHADRLATFACTASVGPGSTNMVTGAALATVNRLPVLLLPSDFFSDRGPDPVLQQLEHPTQHDVSFNDVFRPVARFYTRVSRPEQLLSALPEAMRVLSDPAETGAVVVSLPEDVQAEAYDWPDAFFAPRTWRVRRPRPDATELDAAASRLAKAERPLLIAGGGVRYACAVERLRAFAERWGIPVAETQAGRGSLPWDHPLAVGPLGVLGLPSANRLAREADVVLAVGTRLSDFTTASKTLFRPDASFVALNVVAADAAKATATPLVADALEGLSALDDALARAGARPAGPERRERVRSLAATAQEAVGAARADLGEAGALRQTGVLGAVAAAIGGRGVVINAAGTMPGDLLRLWRPDDPRAYHVEYGYSCMGYEIPAGIGVRMAEADPSRPVAVLIGDGSYLMMNSEIVTAVAEGLDLLIVVVDNGGFQSIHGLQRSVGSDGFGTELRRRETPGGAPAGATLPVDFSAHAAAMGARATFVEAPGDLSPALGRALDAGGVQVVVVPSTVHAAVDAGDPEAWWDVPPAATSNDEGVRAAREAYERTVVRRTVVRWPDGGRETETTR
jgi:3D-(3,5/4)-trihydroxycyclohexane-1,2-dione acylhydrolase (decyclizing)